MRDADNVFVRVWQYVVVEGREAEFQQMYAEDGAWAQLFACSDGFLGTELFRSVGNPRGYLTLDRFESEDAFRRFLEEHAASYAGLDRQTEGLTVSEREIVTGVRPRSADQ